MIKVSLLTIIFVLFSGCTLSKIDSYRSLIKADFTQSQHYRVKKSVKVKVSSFEQDKTIEQLVEKSGLVIELEEFENYEVVNFVVSYDGPYWLETYQVLRFCDKNTCNHKFLLMVAVYA